MTSMNHDRSVDVESSSAWTPTSTSTSRSPWTTSAAVIDARLVRRRQGRLQAADRLGRRARRSELDLRDRGHRLLRRRVDLARSAAATSGWSRCCAPTAATGGCAARPTPSTRRTRPAPCWPAHATAVPEDRRRHGGDDPPDQGRQRRRRARHAPSAMISLKQVLVNAAPELREQLQPLSKMALIDRCAGLRPGPVTTVDRRHQTHPARDRPPLAAPQRRDQRPTRRLLDRADRRQLAPQLVARVRRRPRHRRRDAHRRRRQRRPGPHRSRPGPSCAASPRSPPPPA